MLLGKINKIASIIVFVLILTFVKTVEAQLYINEFLASNVSKGYDTTNYNYVDWIEIYNGANSGLNIGGYYLTDNLNNNVKWQIPQNTIIAPHGWLLIWADGLNTGLHANFKLSSDGEEIGLYAPDKTLIDSVIFIPQQTDISYGRKPDGSGQWLYFDDPTPGSSNSTTGYSTYTRAEIPQFSIEGGFYNGDAEVILSCTSSTATIRYTLDGNEPDILSPEYTSPIQINATTVVRARVFDDGLLAGNTVTHTYFINVNKYLPVFSLVCDSLYLWDTEIGIYQNSAIDQERFANLEYFENEQPVINQNIGIRIHGFVARYLPQKTFGLYAKNKYGNPAFNYKFFDEKDIYSFKSIFLRDGGFPENSSTMFRDGLMQNLTVGKVDIDYQAYKPAVLYLNGKYWGIYNIREKQNGDYLAANHNVDPANVDLLENYWKEIIEGDKIHYNDFMNFITENNINNSTNYNHVKELIDVDNYIDYAITEIYYANTDWPGANVRYWRPREENGRWRWILMDVDFGFGLEAGYDNNTLEFAMATDGTTWANPPSATFLLRKMMESDEFKNEFIQRFAAHLNISYEPSRVINLINSFRNNIVNEMPFQIERWKDEVWTASWGTSYHVISSMELWETEIEEMRQFAELRAENVRQHLTDKFDLTGTYILTTHSDGGYIVVNSVKIPEGTNTGIYFDDVPLRLEAVPAVGMDFLYWTWNKSKDFSENINVAFSNDLEITAVFGTKNPNLIPEIINSDLILTQSGSPYFATGDIIIQPDVTLTVEHGVEILMPDSCCIYDYGEFIINGSIMQPAYIRANKHSNYSRWGAICIQNATGTAQLNNVIIENASHGRNKLLHKAGITCINSDVILNGVSIQDADFPFYSEYGNITILNSSFRSDKTCDMINIKYAGTAIVEGCNIKGNEYPDTDGIDYDHINNGIIRNNYIYGFSGFNSDGIDIGEGASGILIENNRIYNCSDKGISVGQGSSVIIKRNFIYNCNMGVGVKDSLSYALIDQNTFYQNSYSVACFEKNRGAGGGNADIINSIFSQSLISPVFYDSLSVINVTYSLSDTEQMEGTGNINEDPLFVNPLIMNFELRETSPCINTGSPETPPDPDGSVADMGAYFIYLLPTEVNVVINEINYNSHPDFNAGDWIEIYNNTFSDIDMSGWVFKDLNDEHIYHFPEGFVLAKNNYVVVCNEVDSFTTQYPTTWNYRGNFDFGLNNSHEVLRLFDSKMNLVDYVEYTNESPWPVEPDGEGYTLQLINPNLNNSLAQNWEASSEIMGTPGFSNFESSVPDFENNKSLKIFPNPSDGFVRISFKNINSDKVSIEIINIFGQAVYSCEFHGNNTGFVQSLDLRELSQGIYILHLKTGKEIYTGKFILQ